MKRVSLSSILPLLVIGLALVLAACGGSAPEPTATSVPPTDAPAQPPTATEVPPTLTATNPPPTETPEPSPTPTETSAPLFFTVEELMTGANIPASNYEPCELGPLSLACPAGWVQELEEDTHITVASEAALLDGFLPGDSGGQLEIKLFSSFDLGVAAPEDILKDFASAVIPGGIPQENIMDGPIYFQIDQADAAAIVFNGTIEDPELVMMLIALQKHGRIATIGMSASVDAAAELFPLIAQGVSELTFDVMPHSAYMLPPGSTFNVLGTVNGQGTPSRIFTNANQAVFIAVQPLESVDMMAQLINMQGEVLASSDLQGTEYLYYGFKDSGQYGYVVNSKGPVPYVTTIIGTAGITLSADALENTLSCRLDSATSLSYMLMVNEGENIFIQLQAASDDQQLVAEIYELANTSQPLAVIAGPDTQGYLFEPPMIDWYLLAVYDSNGMPGPCMVTVNYVSK